MSLFTSLYPSEHGVRNFRDGEAERLDVRLPTLAELLRAAGYRTHAVVSGGNMSGSLGFDRGFGRYDERTAAARDVFPAAIEALRDLAGCEATPFFLFVHTYEIHDPYVSPPQYRQRFTDPDYEGSVIGSPEELARRAGGKGYPGQRRVYWGAINHKNPEDVQQVIGLYDAGIRVADDHLGLLLQELATLGIEEETAVVVFSDHGEEFWEHGRIRHEQLYEEVLRVPLVLRLPGLPVPPGQRIPTRVRLIDLLPTIAEYLGLEIPAHAQGESMLPLLFGEDRGDQTVFAEYRKRGLASLMTGPWKAVARPSRVERRSFKLRDWAFHLRRPDNRSELFDLVTDPGERTSRAEREPVRLRAMLDSIEKAQKSFEESRLGLGGTPAVLDEKTRRQLEALGYLDR